MKVSSLSILIPCKNEAACIPALLDSIRAAFEELRIQGLHYEIWLCGESPPPDFDCAGMRIISWPEAANLSVQEATVFAARRAQSDWILVMDADLQHPPMAASTQIAIIELEEVHIGHRHNLSALSWSRRIITRSLSMIARWKLRVKLRDPLSGFFLCPRRWLARLEPRPGFKPIIQLLRTPNLKYREFTYMFHPRVTGRSKADVRRLWQTLVAILSRAD